MPPLAPPKGTSTAAHLYVIRVANACTSSISTSSLYLIPAKHMHKIYKLSSIIVGQLSTKLAFSFKICNQLIKPTKLSPCIGSSMFLQQYQNSTLCNENKTTTCTSSKPSLHVASQVYKAATTAVTLYVNT